MVQEAERGIHLVHWFRSKGLRFHDQPSLYEVIKRMKEIQRQSEESGERVLALTWRCVYLLDPWFASSSSSVNKWQFLLESLEDLDNKLRKMGSRLFVVRGQPSHVFPQLFKGWSTTHLTFEMDPEPFAKVRDTKIRKLCSDLGVIVNSCPSHTLFNLSDILKRCSALNTPYPLTFKSFQSVISFPEPLEPPHPCPPIDGKLMNGISSPIGDDHDQQYGVPTISDLGFPYVSTASSKWPGGETEALLRLERHLQHKVGQRFCHFSRLTVLCKSESDT